MTLSSFPLMALARRYGASYDDVLVWAGYLRLDRVSRLTPSPGRMQAMCEATGRLQAMCEATGRLHRHLGDEPYLKLLDAIVTHADERWGAPEPIQLSGLHALGQQRAPDGP